MSGNRSAARRSCATTCGHGIGAVEAWVTVLPAAAAGAEAANAAASNPTDATTTQRAKQTLRFFSNGAKALQLFISIPLYLDAEDNGSLPLVGKGKEKVEGNYRINYRL